jgi:uncharacterized membrane protein
VNTRVLSRRSAVLGLAVAVVGATVVGLSGPAQAAATGCRISTLPVPAGVSSSYASYADPTGRYLLGATNRGGATWTNAMWINGRYTEVPVPAPQARAIAVNSRGDVLGNSVDEHGAQERPWVSRNAKVTFLPAVAEGHRLIAENMNGRGDIVGSDQAPAGQPPTRPVLWPADRPGTVRVLDLPTGVSSGHAVGVDEDGTVIGRGSVNGATVGLMWPVRGKPRLLVGPDGKSNTYLDGIRNGWVVGSLFDNMDGGVVRWNLRTGSVELLRPSRRPTAINGKGTVLVDGQVVHGDRTVDLPRPPSSEVAAGNAIADSGLIAGAANLPYMLTSAVMWRGC